MDLTEKDKALLLAFFNWLAQEDINPANDQAEEVIEAFDRYAAEDS